MERCPVKSQKFNMDFPPLMGENKNPIEGKTELIGRQIILSSGQAPAAVAQAPTRQPGPGQPPARLGLRQLQKDG
ncbi:hypothetical protein DSO57_1034519 [Entomophthora muscae]|uniref:Uncharacterized protein n=1 Tax=Entomophthora muscae TaxID=34485 RepID=A0ACC2REI2_9FUNG|nr:hypothetical protein DSO57_1034519 [Entomophthora muscae]